LSAHSPEIHFGGPGQPGYLRDVLFDYISQVPARGSIHWVTYYFRDRRLARALIQARQRGVRVSLALAATPRTCHANDAVIEMLGGGDNGLGDGLRLISLPGIPAPSGRAWRPQLHEKLYCFSHPRPIALIGSFNPSGDVPEESPDIIREIGDQGRGHNVLVGLTEPGLVAALVQHAQQMHSHPPGLLHRFSAAANQSLTGRDIAIHFWPRLGPHPLLQFLRRFGRGSHIRIAASHIRAKSAVSAIIAAAEKGASVEILAEHTLRRVTKAVERRFVAAGINFRRIQHAENIPMHLKFVLLEEGGRAWTMFGSFNWTKPSFWLNHEIAAISSDPELFKAFDKQWQQLKSQPPECQTHHQP